MKDSNENENEKEIESEMKENEIENDIEEEERVFPHLKSFHLIFEDDFVPFEESERNENSLEINLPSEVSMKEM